MTLATTEIIVLVILREQEFIRAIFGQANKNFKKSCNLFMVLKPIVIKDEKDVEHTVAFEVRDGIVQRYWKEG